MKIEINDDLLQKISRYIPKLALIPNQATAVSGRLLEEAVELHLESGGSASSAQMHVTDAIANECFKVLKRTTNNQAAYPSKLQGTYSFKGYVEEISDVLFLLIVNIMVAGVNVEAVFDVIRQKVEKLEIAEREGCLTITEKGLFYIRKD